MCTVHIYKTLLSIGAHYQPKIQSSSFFLLKDPKVFRFIDHHSIRYIWDPSKRDYIKLHGLDTGVKCMTFHDDLKGVSTNQRASL